MMGFLRPKPLRFERSGGAPKRGRGGWVSGKDAAAQAASKRGRAASRASGAPANLSPKAIKAARKKRGGW